MISEPYYHIQLTIKYRKALLNSKIEKVIIETTKGFKAEAVRGGNAAERELKRLLTPLNYSKLFFMIIDIRKRTDNIVYLRP